MDAALRALAEPNRRTILRLVQDEERSAGDIASRFELTRPAVSQHLTVLKNAGLLEERRVGTRRLYSVRPKGFQEVRAFLDEFWDDRLERLKREAEHAERSRTDDRGN
jgi:DNA-binding transcriptional ArsR family regulator